MRMSPHKTLANPLPRVPCNGCSVADRIWTLTEVAEPPKPIHHLPNRPFTLYSEG